MRIFHCRLLCISFLLYMPLAAATEQIKEVFIVGDTSYPIRQTPLNQRFHPDVISELIDPQICSASWRGYRGTWRLRDGFLWLSHIRKSPCSDRYERVEADVLFADAQYPVRADWYTGKIILPVGDKKFVYPAGIDPVHHSAEDMLGYDLEAFVFNFKDGELVSKGVETIQRRYER